MAAIVLNGKQTQQETASGKSQKQRDPVPLIATQPHEEPCQHEPGARYEQLDRAPRRITVKTLERGGW
jgi:hypothetical protein